MAKKKFSLLVIKKYFKNFEKMKIKKINSTQIYKKFYKKISDEKVKLINLLKELIEIKNLY